MYSGRSPSGRSGRDRDDRSRDDAWRLRADPRDHYRSSEWCERWQTQLRDMLALAEIDRLLASQASQARRDTAQGHVPVPAESQVPRRRAQTDGEFLRELEIAPYD